jgi:hypothetical protein
MTISITSHRTLFSLAVTVFLASAPSTQAAQPSFGCGARGTARSLSVEGTTHNGGLDSRFHLTLDMRDGRFAISRDFGVFTEAEGFDGMYGWSRDRSGGSHSLDATAARAITITEAWILRHGWCKPGPAVIEQVADGAFTVWQAKPPGGIPAILRFDRASGELRQSEIRMWGNRLIRHYADWRNVDSGVMVAFSQRDEDPEDEDVEEIHVTSVHIGSAVPSAAFKRPARPRDYEVLGGANSTTVPYEDDGAARIYLPVLVNGKGPFSFELDSGGHLIIGKELAGTLDLQAEGQFANSGAGTVITMAGMAAGQEIRIGEAVMHHQVAKVRNFINDRPSGRPPRAGLLGLELFERFAVAIDRGAKTVTLTPLERFKGGHGTPLPIRFIEDAPMTMGSYRGAAGLFEIDSGNASPTFIEGYWARQQGFDRDLRKGFTLGGRGDTAEWLSRADLTLGPVKLQNEIVAYVGEPERGAESTRLQAGLSGEWALRRFDMIYDYRREIVWIGKRHDVPEPPYNRTGMMVEKDGDVLKVSLLAAESPAAEAGLRIDDRIIAIDGEQSTRLSIRDALLLLRKPAGTDLALLVVAQDGGNPRPVTLHLRELLP